MRHSVDDPLHFCDGKWHKIQVWKIEKTVKIQVDENPVKTNKPQELDGTSVDISDPLYVGGLPGTATTLFIS